MSRKTLFKRTQILMLILALSVFLIETTAFAATELIKANKGGKIKLAPGVQLKFEKAVLKKDTVIYGEIIFSGDQVTFHFGPSGLVFYDYEYADKLDKLVERHRKKLGKLEEDYEEDKQKLEEKYADDPDKYSKKLEKLEKERKEKLEKEKKEHEEKSKKLEKESEKKDIEAELEVSWELVVDALDLTLYGDAVIWPEINKNKVKWKIPHFSRYYYRRR
jgi:hypothetical protein